MPIVQKMSPIPPQYIMYDVLDATIRIVTGRHWRTRVEILDIMREAGVRRDEWVNCYQTEKPTEWLFQFWSHRAASDFCSVHSCVYDENGERLYVALVNSEILNVRVHWVPIYYTSDVIRICATKWGEILDLEERPHGQAQSNVFSIKLQSTMEQKKNLPHLIDMQDGTRFLVTVQGRPPLCLHCGEVGHVRSRCEAYRSGQRRIQTYADTVTKAPIQEWRVEDKVSEGQDNKSVSSVDSDTRVKELAQDEYQLQPSRDSMDSELLGQMTDREQDPTSASSPTTAVASVAREAEVVADGSSTSTTAVTSVAREAKVVADKGPPSLSPAPTLESLAESQMPPTPAQRPTLIGRRRHSPESEEDGRDAGIRKETKLDDQCAMSPASAFLESVYGSDTGDGMLYTGSTEV